MLIKAASDRTRDLETLTSLMAHPGATAAVRSRIEQEIRNIRAGAKGEAEAAYEIDFHHKASRNWAVIHDLRLEHHGRVAQIDHLLIDRALDIWVCESKHFSEGVAINEHGEFTAFFNSRPYGVSSPLEQNRKHVAVLQAVLDSGLVNLPTRLGMSLRPKLHSVVLVSKSARITRPQTTVEGIESIIKSDQLRTHVERSIDGTSVAGTLISVAKYGSSEALEQVAHQIAGLHRPITFNWAAKFGLGARADSTSVERSPPTAQTPGTSAEVGRSPGRAVNDKVSIKAQVEVRPQAEAARPDEQHQGRLSTSKLAARHGIKSTSAMLDLLTSSGLLIKEGEQHRLSPHGIASGAVFVEKSRFGPYFLSPEDIQIAR